MIRAEMVNISACGRRKRQTLPADASRASFEVFVLLQKKDRGNNAAHNQPADEDLAAQGKIWRLIDKKTGGVSLSEPAPKRIIALVSQGGSRAIVITAPGWTLTRHRHSRRPPRCPRGWP
jgi:hypothetical protein